jgi:hypothetical protein
MTDIHFTDNPSIRGREDRYVIMKVKAALVVESWRASLFSFEWLRPDGNIRSIDELPLHERDKRLKVEKALASGHSLDRPVLGIGLMENVEIGAGRDVLLTLAANGVEEIEAHVPKSARQEFKSFTVTLE